MQKLDVILADATSAEEKASSLFVIEIDQFSEIADRFEPSAIDKIRKAVGDRMVAVSRDPDVISRIGDSRFGLCLGQVQHLDLESCIQLASRLQSAIEEPIAIDGTSTYVTVSIGFCLLSRAPAMADKTGSTQLWPL